MEHIGEDAVELCMILRELPNNRAIWLGWWRVVDGKGKGYLEAFRRIKSLYWGETEGILRAREKGVGDGIKPW